VKWCLFICSDCDSDDGVVVLRKPDDVNPESASGIDNCPGCGSYLSLINMGDVDVTGSSLVHLRLRTAPVDDEADE
jgi:hypothetical protein